MSESPKILGIQIAADKGLPMQSLEHVKIVDSGIEGDRYASGKGAFSKSPPPRNIDRHITLIQTEMIEAVNAEKGISITFADTRRNLLTIGIPLNDLVGKKFQIGEVLVEGVELCEPCGRPGTLSANADVKQHFKEAFVGRGGLRVRVLGTGEIHQGDEIKLVE